MFDELKNNWKNQASNEAPSVEIILNSIKEEKNKMLVKSLVGILLLSMTIVVFWLIWYFIPFKYMMTKVALLAMGVIIGAAVGYLIYLRSQVPKNAAGGQRSKVYLQEWISYQEKTKQHVRAFMTLYMTVIIVGMGFYLYEVTEFNKLFRICAYGATGVWFLVFLLYLKPRWTKQSDARIQGIIDHYQRISDQL